MSVKAGGSGEEGTTIREKVSKLVTCKCIGCKVMWWRGWESKKENVCDGGQKKGTL